MTEPDESFDPAEVAAAEALDDQIDEVLAGRAGPDTARTVTWLSTMVRTDPPAGLAQRVEEHHERVLRRHWWPVRLAAGALACLFISQGVGNLVIGDWVARGIGEAHSLHFVREGAFALIAAGLAILTGVLQRRMVPVSVLAGVPLAIAFGISGIGEIGVFAAGAVLHITQGVVGVALAVTYWRYRRDTSRPPDEGRA
jgi:hypothetical protein